MGRRGEHTREEYRAMALNSAREIVRNEGYRGLTARKIAAGIGYTVGSLYLVFKNLDDLIVQVNEETMVEIQTAITTGIGEAKTPEAAVYAAAHAYLDFAHANAHLWRMVFEHKLPPDQPLHESFKNKIADSFAFYARAITPLTGDAAKNPAALSAHALWAGIHGICVLSVTGKLESASLGEATQLLDHLIRNFLIGIKA